MIARSRGATTQSRWFADAAGFDPGAETSAPDGQCISALRNRRLLLSDRLGAVHQYLAAPHGQDQQPGGRSHRGRFALSNVNTPHLTLFPGGMTYVLLFTEAHRYRHYDAWRGRVLFLARFFNREMSIPAGWNAILSEDLRNPNYKSAGRKPSSRA